VLNGGGNPLGSCFEKPVAQWSTQLHG
jgi:hypothetical protein